jgi:CRP-like cAMP-binding protein
METEILSFKRFIQQSISINDEDFNTVLNLIKVKKIKKREFLLNQGVVCNEVSFVSKGLLRNYYLKDGNEINTCFCMENTLSLSLESLLSRSSSKESIQAIEDSTIVSLSYTNLMKLYTINSKWESLSRILTEKECLRLSNKAEVNSFKTAKNKYQRLLENEPKLIQRVPIQYLASYIGVSRETISRVRSMIG